jgi:hypothetical protein
LQTGSKEICRVKVVAVPARRAYALQQGVSDEEAESEV